MQGHIITGSQYKDSQNRIWEITPCLTHKAGEPMDKYYPEVELHELNPDKELRQRRIVTQADFEEYTRTKKLIRIK